MKKISFVLAILGIATVTCFSQEKIMLSPKFEIPASKIETRKKGTENVQFVALSNLKQGNNYMKLKTGLVLVVNYSGKSISQVLTTNSKGQVIGKPLSTNGASQFQCSSGFCMCRGDGDCNDMFGTNVCGPHAVCFGDVCVCYR